MNVAVCCEKHSQMFGHFASWQTVWRRLFLMSPLTLSYEVPVGKRLLSHGGFRFFSGDLTIKGITLNQIELKIG